MINLELPKKVTFLRDMAHALAKDVFRPIARKYDKIEHCDEVPELNAVAKLLSDSAGSMQSSQKKEGTNTDKLVKNGSNMQLVTAMEELCWGCTGLTLSIPAMGLGNSAIDAVATDEQKKIFGDKFAAMAITEPGCGSDSANIQTTAELDGDEWVINGEKIFATAASRSEAVVVWATLDKSQGKAAIKSFVVLTGTPGMEIVRCEDKMGIRVSDTTALRFSNCRIPKNHILGSPEIADTKAARKKAFGGVMQTFDNARPQVAAMALGVGQAALEITLEVLKEEGITPSYDKKLLNSTALEAEIYRMEADLEAARLLTYKAAWMLDNKQANSKEASMSKAKAGRVGNYITLRCVEICQSLGYSEELLLEKFARDSKIIDIYEGTQQIQQLIVARHVLGLSSSQLK